VLHCGLHKIARVPHARLNGAVVLPSLIAFQLLCGCFAGYVASQKGRNWFFWFLVGLVPVLGVILALIVEKPHHPQARRDRTDGDREVARERRPPLRCRGEYIPDCQGCPYFRKPLFDPTYAGTRKGWCDFFHKDLRELPSTKGIKIILKDD